MRRGQGSEPRRSRPGGEQSAGRTQCRTWLFSHWRSCEWPLPRICAPGANDNIQPPHGLHLDPLLGPPLESGCMLSW